MVCGLCNIPSMMGSSSGPVDPRLSGFSSLFDLCSSYPIGMGYYCSPYKILAIHPPTWPLYGEFLYVKRFCESCCWCEESEDLPEDEDMDDAGRAPPGALEIQECSSESDSSNEIVANECAESAGDPLRTDNIGCSAFVYGHPSELACGGDMGTNAMVHHASDEPLQVREFMMKGVDPRFPGYEKVETPKSFVSGMQHRSSCIAGLRSLLSKNRNLWSLSRHHWSKPV